MSPTASGARRRARGVGGDARPQRGGLLDQTLKELVGALRDRDLAFEVLVVENGSTDSTLADARDLRGRRSDGVGAHPAGRRLRRGHAGRDPRRGRRRWSWCSTSTTTTPRSSTVVLPLLTARRRPRDRRRFEARTGHPRHAPVAAPRDHRWIRDGAAVGLRPSGVGHPRDEGDAARRRSSRSSARCRNGTDLFDTELVLRADRAGLAVAEVPVTVEERRPSRTPIARRSPAPWSGLVRLRIQLWRERPVPMTRAPVRRRALRAPGRVARGR